MSSATPAKRIASMDQFRGYTIAGMFLVNFVGSFTAIHSVLKHNDNYFSYADSIMPSFMFACGFSYRLTYLRRRKQMSLGRTNWTYIRRSLALVLVSLALFGTGHQFRHFAEFSEMPPEFESTRPRAPRTESFAALVGKAPGAISPSDVSEVVANAAEAGRLLNGPEPKSEPQKSQYAAAQRAARLALDEGAPFVDAALRRGPDWKALGPVGRHWVHWRIFAAKLLKANLWETLAIIGVTQIVLLPVIGCSLGVRTAALVGLGAIHALISYWFNWDFLYALNDNWMTKLWMTGRERSWDGGFFGPLSWGVAMLGGSLAYDFVVGSASNGAAARKLLVWGASFMVVGYAMSCLTRLYDLSDADRAAIKARGELQNAERRWLNEVIRRQEKLVSTTPAGPDRDRLQGTILVLRDQQTRYPRPELAESPVLPPFDRLKGRSWKEMLAEPPFVAPPPASQRQQNYWMMGKRMPNLSFITFATGFSFALYGLFVLACDVAGLRIGVFRTLGTNALLAYIIHEIINNESEGSTSIVKLVPHDAPLWFCLGGFAVFFFLTWLFVRQLEKQGIYLKL